MIVKLNKKLFNKIRIELKKSLIIINQNILFKKKF